jgi:MYXO-CTERM domain-containing protein
VTPLGYYSDGSATGDTLTWTLGYFNDGFTPSETNFDDWAANYVEVDRDTERFFTPFFAVSGIKEDVGTAAAGKQAWIFAFNDLGKIGTTEGEALLFAEDGFLFPEVLFSGTFDIEDNPFDGIDDAFTVVWGQVDRDRDAAGGRITGGGEFSNQLADTSTLEWEAQTATWPIPEPSVMLMGLAALALLGRRRRSSKI